MLFHFSLCFKDPLVSKPKAKIFWSIFFPCILQFLKRLTGIAHLIHSSPDLNMNGPCLETLC